MTVGLKDPCPCGSGKRYKHCHRALDGKRQKRASWVVLAVIFAAALAAIVLFFGRNRGGTAPVASTGNATARTTGTTIPMPTATGSTGATGEASQNQAPLADGHAPQAYEFDAAGNRHWDPTHQHWHTGPPPPESLRGPGTTTSATSASGAPVQVNTTTRQIPVPNAVDQSPLPDGSAPQPYQFDASKNRHWDPGHRHWHIGPAPAGGATKATTTVTPAAPVTGTTTTGGN
jgi:hypothetical protein